jgi:hypothetical protein
MPDCVTDISTDSTSVPDNVSVAVRGDVVPLAVAVTDMLLDDLVTVNQDELADLLTDHTTFDVTGTPCVEPPLGNVSEDVDTVNVGRPD